MADVAVTNTFSPNTTAQSGQVNTNFTDITSWLNLRNAGTTFWDAVVVSKSASGSDLPITLSNTSNTASSSARLRILTAGSTASDPALSFTVTGQVSYTLGIDNSVSGDPLVLSASSDLGTNDLISMVDSAVTITGDAAQTELALDNTAADGDPVVTFKLSGSQKYVMGVDDSDSDAFIFATSGITTDAAWQVPSTGNQLQVKIGSAGTPGLAFIGDVNSGIYSTGVDQMAFTLGGVQVIGILSTAFNPAGAGAISSGNGTDYWNDISYKTLTDRGCIPWCDDGVEMADGRRVSDLDAIAEIDKHPSRLTPTGLPRLDYETFPKHAYKRAEDELEGESVERDANGDAWVTRTIETGETKRVQVQDGVEMTMVFGLMIGALKELRERILVLEGK